MGSVCSGAPTTVSGSCARQYEGSETPSFPSAFFLCLLPEDVGTVFGALSAGGLLAVLWKRPASPQRFRSKQDEQAREVQLSLAHTNLSAGKAQIDSSF